jgi:hypothetical protein
MKPLATHDGLTVLVPASGDQSWDSDLPATPYFSPRLHLRVPDDLSRGFTKQPLAGSQEPADASTDPQP